MDKKMIVGAVGSSLAAATVFIGTITAGVSAQTTPTSPTTGSTATSPASPPSAQTTPGATTAPESSEAHESGLPFAGGKERGRGGKGFGGRGEDGFDWGPGGFAATAGTANRQITNATDFLARAKSDLTYATGKMDTANIQKWLNSADTLIKNAQAAVTATKYESAGLTAGAAMGLIKTAESQMAYTLGYDKLPSASQRVNGHKGRGEMKDVPGASTLTITQAQASRMLAQTYRNLVSLKAFIKTSDATPYLTDAQNAYQTAYTAYNAGKYNDAVSAAHMAEQLANVGKRIQAAADAPATPDTAVPVPGPSF